ncbi:MAG: ABC transporter ATP-binding protein [Nitrospinae bacterium]|nr:ABC transporter ATP-binding protein [Nitrospinota bacterium]
MIEIKNLSKIYNTGIVKVHALKNISFSINSGEFVSIMGPSGSGKSTLMNIIGCLDIPTEGIYLLEGVDIKDLTDDRLAEIRNKRIGFVFQSHNLLPRTTALENVELPLLYAGIPDAKERAMESLKSVGLEKRADHSPAELSGGESQRVAIARAVVTNPAIIMADEPTGNLDTQTSNEIMEIFCRLNDSGVTIIMVTHEKDIAEYSKRVISIKDGGIIKDELFKRTNPSPYPLPSPLSPSPSGRGLG